MTNFKDALTILSGAKVSFIVVGAYAGVLQGSAQVTQGSISAMSALPRI
jgi:hypothetical protein